LEPKALGLAWKAGGVHDCLGSPPPPPLPPLLSWKNIPLNRFTDFFPKISSVEDFGFYLVMDSRICAVKLHWSCFRVFDGRDFTS